MNDPRFSPESIENACAIAQNMNSAEQKQAVDLLNEWTEQPSSIFTALQLVRTTNNFYTSFVSSSLIKNKIPFFWGQMDINQKNEYRNSLTALVGSAPDVKNNISYNLIHALCDIALFDWPDDFPGFSEIIFPTTNTNTLIISLRILSVFMEELDTTNIITDLHRNELRDLIITNHHDKITNIITSFIMVPELAVDVLTICNYMLRWGSTRDIIDFNLFQQLSTTFLTNELTCEKAVQCLSSIFISRNDSAVAFRTFSPFLADALAKGVFPNQRPVTTNTHVLVFLLRFLTEYSSIFELALIYNQAKADPTMVSLIDENVSLLVTTMEEKGVNPAVLRQDLLQLYQIILSIPPDQIANDCQTPFWQLWDNNLRRVLFEQNHQMPVNPSSLFFLPILNEIRQSLYNSIITSVDEDGVCSFQTRATTSTLYMINPTQFVDFLKKQPPSPQLCYAIGTIEIVLDSSRVDNLLMIIVELFNHLRVDQSREYQAALLFGLSHSTKCYSSDNQLFSQFVEFICTAMTGNDEMVANAATNALQYIVQRRAGLFKGDCRYFAELLINQSEAYLNNLERQAAIRVFKVCTWLISYNKRGNVSEGGSSALVNAISTMMNITGIELIDSQGNRITADNLNGGTLDENSCNELYVKLFRPIVAVLSNPEKVPPKTVESALDIIRECCYASPSLSSCISSFMFPPLFNLAANMIPNQNFQSGILWYVLTAISAMQANLPYSAVSQQINEVFQLMIRRQRIDESFFDYFVVLRDNFNELDAMYPLIHQQMIVPFLATNEPFPPSMFLMIGQFTPNVVDIEWLTVAVIKALSDMRTDVGEEALSALQSMMYKLSKDNLIKFLNNVAPQLVAAVIQSIVDLCHMPLFVKSVDFLRFIVISAEVGPPGDQTTTSLQEMMKKVIATSLRQAAPEPSQGFFDNFAAYLLSVQRQFFKFKAAFGNLLVVLRKASPGDAELFKIEPVHQNSLFSMLFDNMFKNLLPVFDVQAVDDGNMPNRSRLMAKMKRRKAPNQQGPLVIQQQDNQNQNQQQQQQAPVQ